MRVLVAQLNPIVGDLHGNTKKALKAIEKARFSKADVVLFPELTICGYPPEDLVHHPHFIEEMQNCLHIIAQACKGIMAIVGLVRKNEFVGEKPLLNSAAVIQDGKVVGFHDKWLLPTYDVFDERRYFEPGSTIQVWEWRGKKMGVIICEDIWQHAGYVSYTRYHRDPILELVPLKPDLLLNLSASPYQFQKTDTRVKVCAASAKTLSCPVLLCCQVGGNDQLIFDGYSVCVDKKGHLRELAKGFTEDLMLVDLDAPVCPCTFHYDPLRDLYQALVLGVRDYFHKSGFSKGCLGLSGGIDSALTACIAVDALGKENVLGVLMPSRYTSASSIKDAEDLAKNLGIRHINISIEKPFGAFLGILEPHFEGKAPDITEENLQSRTRGVILMALSNKLGYVVLSTGNKSEMAMGFATLYGDMCGGLSVLSDVLKAQVYKLAALVNKDKEIIPRSTMEKVPTAELRPNQKDTDSLPEYAVVDVVLQSYVEEYLSPEEIAKKHDLPLDLVTDLVQRIHNAEYKRRQSPPGIRVSKKAFRVGRRYPIVQGWM